MSGQDVEKLVERAQQCIEEGKTLAALLLLDEAAKSLGTQERFLFLLDTAIEEVEELAEVAQKIEPPSAVGAEIKAFQGTYAEAYEELAEFALATKSPHLLQWMKRWSAKKSFWDELTKEKAKLLFIKTIGRFGGRNLDALKPVFQALEPIAKQIVSKHCEDAEMLFYCSSILREGGRVEEALKLAEETYGQHQSWHLAVNLAYARRDVGDIDGAQEAFAEAERLEPKSDDVKVDLAVMLFDNGRAEEAFAVLEKVLLRSPQHFCGYPVYCREMCLRKGHESKFLELREFATQQGRGTSAFAYAQSCLKTMVDAGPLIRHLPAPEDVSIKLLARVLPETKEKVTISASHVEAPSVFLALKLATESRDLDLNYSLIDSGPWTPNPLAPRRPYKEVLWTYKNGKRELLVGKPDVLVAEMVYSVASGHYHIDEWWDLCNTVARDIGPNSLHDLLGTMVHFDSQMPFPRPAWKWIQAVQVAAAMTLAQLERQWECPSKKTLFALAEGPVDWVVNGAILALSQLAKTQPEHKEEVQEVLLNLFNDLTKWQWCCYSSWLRHALLDLTKVKGQLAKEILSFYE